MKFLMVSAFTGHSGSAIRFINIAVQLQRLGHTVVYVERKSPEVVLGPLPEGIPTFRCPVTRNLIVDMVLSAFFNFGMLLRNLDCGVYYALKPGPNNCLPALCAKLLGKRVFLDVDDLDYGYFPAGLKRRISQWFFDGLPRFFEVVTCHTQNLRKYLVDTLRLPPSRIHFLAQGVSEVFLNFRVGDSTPQKSIVYSATLGITSDFPDLMPLFCDVIRANPGLVVKVIGDGVRRSEFEALCESVGLSGRMIFHGWVDHGALPAVLADNWVGLNFMRKTFHNDCRAILKIREYLAVRLQVVCNDVGDANTFKDHVHIESSLDSMTVRINEILRGGWCPNVGGRLTVQNDFAWGRIVSDFCQERMLQ